MESLHFVSASILHHHYHHHSRLARATFCSGDVSFLKQTSTVQEPAMASSAFFPCRTKKNTSRICASAAAETHTAHVNLPVQTLRARQVQDVVIVGGGIAGLATALALHRVGITAILLEQSERLRTAGAAIGVWTNAWKALETLGVADGLREKFIRLSGFEILGEDGNVILNLGFEEATRDVELRAVDRKALLEALRDPLPGETVFYDCQVVGITRLNGGYTEVECANGQTFQTKVLVGCDGVNSVVAKWMNIKGPRYAGYTATRGLATFPDGHTLNDQAMQILGRGVRGGFAPMDTHRVYWFVMFNAPNQRITDQEVVRKEALNYVADWSPMLTEAINLSPLDSFSRRGISDRWMWPVGSAPLYKGGVTLAGDAMHPMTPNLGQGGCCALEDAIILARALCKACSSKNHSLWNGYRGHQPHEMEQIELALKSYTQERWPRMLPLAIRSYLTGALLQLDSDFICSARNDLLPKLVNADRFINHTFYDCGTL